MSANTKTHQDAPRASGRVLEKYVAVTFELEELTRSVKLLREFLDHGGKDDGIGVRILASLLHCQLLGQKLLAMEIAARG